MSDVNQHQSRTTTPVMLTPSAKQHVLSYLKKHQSLGLRLSVKKSGCSGFSYVMDYVDAPHEGDVIVPMGDGYVICIDKASYPYLKGINMDYVKEGLNHKFIFENPNQTGQCGCGESFIVDTP